MKEKAKNESPKGLSSQDYKTKGTVCIVPFSWLIGDYYLLIPCFFGYRRFYFPPFLLIQVFAAKLPFEEGIVSHEDLARLRPCEGTYYSHLLHSIYDARRSAVAEL